MPIYEFYCRDCHTIFNFISRRINTEKIPPCPRCNRPELEKQVSPFAISRGLEEKPNDDFPDLDDSRMEQAMATLAGEMGGMDEDDPKAMARFMRRFSEVSGMDLGGGMEEAISRLEAGEDPEAIEADMGDLFEGDNPFGKEKAMSFRRRHLPPAHDETLYPL